MKILPTDFDGQAIRHVYDESTESWWFSVIDMVQALTRSTYANRHWSDLKRKLAQDAGSEQPVEKIARWAGVSVAQHEPMKGLGSHNLRGCMSEAKLIFAALAKLSTRQGVEHVGATWIAENKTTAQTGGRIARQARNQLKIQTGKSAGTADHYLPPAAPKAAKAMKPAKAIDAPKKP
jgi:hypothetical protein